MAIAAFTTRKAAAHFSLPRSMGLLGVARANTAVGVSPETFLLLHFSLYDADVLRLPRLPLLRLLLRGSSILK
jgi:hypothetical protein